MLSIYIIAPFTKEKLQQRAARFMGRLKCQPDLTCLVCIYIKSQLYLR